MVFSKLWEWRSNTSAISCRPRSRACEAPGCASNKKGGDDRDACDVWVGIVPLLSLYPIDARVRGRGVNKRVNWLVGVNGHMSLVGM